MAEKWAKWKNEAAMAGTDSAGANGDDELVSTGLRLTEMPRVVNDDDEDYGAGAFASVSVVSQQCT